MGRGCVLSLAPLKFSLVVCVGQAPHLNSIAVPGAVKLRIAPDEVILLGANGSAERVVRFVHDCENDRVLAVDQTDGFVGWSLRGESAFELFARMSAVNVSVAKPSFHQGLVERVPTKILATDHRLDLLISSTLGHHVRDRILSIGRDLGVHEADEVEFQPTAEMKTII